MSPEIEIPGVASTSQIKIGAVEKALEIEGVEGYASESLVNELPIGYEEIRQGALNRIRTAREKGARGVIYAIENGIEKKILIKDGEQTEVWVDYAIVIVDDGAGHVGESRSEELVFPNDAVEAMFAIGPDKVTVGQMIAEMHKDEGVNKQDPHKYLTHGLRSREDFLVPAIRAAKEDLLRRISESSR